jgi:hypothetical protein
MHVVVERRAEAVEEGDATEPRAGSTRCVGSSGDACGSAQQSLDLVKEDPRERRDGSGPVGEEAAQPLRHGDHPLPHGHRRDDVIDKIGDACGSAQQSLDLVKEDPRERRDGSGPAP